MSITISSGSLPNLTLSLRRADVAEITLPADSGVPVEFTFDAKGTYDLLGVKVDGFQYISRGVYGTERTRLNHTPSIETLLRYPKLREEARAAKQRQIRAAEEQLAGLRAELEAI